MAANDHPRDRVRQFLLRRLAGMVRRPLTHRLGMLSGQFFTTAEGAYAFEYAGCDAGRGDCAGEVIGAWFVDSGGMRPVEAMPRDVPGDLRGMWFRFGRVHFHIAPAGDWVVLGTLAGARAGCGGRYAVVPKGEGFVLQAEGSHWRA